MNGYQSPSQENSSQDSTAGCSALKQITVISDTVALRGCRCLWVIRWVGFKLVSKLMKQHFDLEYSIRTSLNVTFSLKLRLNDEDTQGSLLLLPGPTEMKKIGGTRRLMCFPSEVNTYPGVICDFCLSTVCSCMVFSHLQQKQVSPLCHGSAFKIRSDFWLRFPIIQRTLWKKKCPFDLVGVRW